MFKQKNTYVGLIAILCIVIKIVANIDVPADLQAGFVGVILALLGITSAGTETPK